VIRRIKELLYEEGYTIAGAKKRLQSELEDGRSFAAPEVDGELFTPEGEGEDEIPVIPVDSVAAAESGEPDESRGTAEDAESGERAESAAPEPENEPLREASAVEAPPSPAPEVEESAPTRSSRRSRGKAAAVVEAPPAGEVASAPAAVDSALSERVETLEHGLRRVLAEVRNLRELLADPSGDR
jgi:hypothetical protein